MTAYRLVKMVYGYPLTSAGPYRVYSSRAEVLQALGPHEECSGDYAGTFNPRHPAATDYYLIARSTLDPQLVAVTDTPAEVGPVMSFYSCRPEYSARNGERVTVKAGPYGDYSGLVAYAVTFSDGVTVNAWAEELNVIPGDAPVTKGGALESTNPRVPNPFPREYKGWIINARNVFGMYTATNYGGGYLQVAADTLAGVKRCINHEIANPR